jgi:hypothetical protein
VTVEPRGAQDYERRSVWLALAVGLAVILRSPGFVGYGGDHHKFQVWAYVASLIAFGLSVCLCLLLLVPEVRARLGRRLREDRLAFVWALGLFVVGILITIVSFAELAIDSLDEDTPFG